MSTAGLSAPGTASYSSNTMSVGDGTWDSNRNDFLLPNLQGLNFATMQYNGMGNRFKGLPEYHVLILGHGILAAIVFIVMVPAAIFIAKFWHSESRMAFKLHIYIQILVVFLSTVILVLGWFAVGPERSLTNPHHGIGVAIYVCILVQFLYGWLMFKHERKRKAAPRGLPLSIYVHRLFGRSIAVLGFVQIALGLTLYGSPKALFILYALAGFVLLFAYIALRFRFTYRAYTLPRSDRPPPSEYYSDYGDGSYVSRPQTEPAAAGGRRRDDRSHWAEEALAAAGLLGAYEWWKKRRDKRRSEKEDRYDEQMDSRVSRPSSRPGSQPPSRPPSRPPGSTNQYGPGIQYLPSHEPSGMQRPPPPPGGYIAARPPSRGSRASRMPLPDRDSEDTWEHDDEKHDETQKNTWRDRILGAGAGIAAFEGVKSLFGSRRSKRNKDNYLESASLHSRRDNHRYGPASEIDQNTVSQADVSRVEAGQPPFSPNDQRRHQAVRPDTLTPISPSRPPPRRRPSVDAVSYAEVESHGPHRRPANSEDQTLRETIGALGLIAGTREWNKRRRQRRIDMQAERIRRQEIEDEELFNQRNSGHYPLPEHSTVVGRRPSLSGTLMTGPDPAVGSNPEVSRQNFRPDTMQPPLPATAGALPVDSVSPPSAVHPFASSHNVVEHQQQQPYSLPPPPPGPPPALARPVDYQAPAPGSLQMPQGAINPDPSRLLSQQNLAQTSSHAAESAFAAGAAGATIGASRHQRTQSQSPSRYRDSQTRLSRYSRRGSTGSGTISQAGPSGAASTTDSAAPPVRLKVQVHDDGNHVTLRRLNDQEAAAERNSRQRPGRIRRHSSLSSGGEDVGSRYRRQQNIRPSADQPFANVPLPPTLSSSAGRPSPPRLQTADPSRHPQALLSPQAQGGAPQQQIPPPPHSLALASGPAESGAFASPPNIMSDTGTDASTFDTNRRRRRAERARRDAAAKSPRVDFE